MKKILIGLSLLVAAPIAVLAADTATTVMPGSDRDSHGCIGSAGYVWNESTQKCVRPWEQSGSTTQYATGLILPPPPPKMLTGAEAETRALQMAMQSLSETDKAELSKIIRTYLEGKGVKIPTAEQVQIVREENKADRKEIRNEIKTEKKELKEQFQTEKKALQESVKKKREELRKRVQDRRTNASTATGTVTQ